MQKLTLIILFYSRSARRFKHHRNKALRRQSKQLYSELASSCEQQLEAQATGDHVDAGCGERSVSFAIAVKQTQHSQQRRRLCLRGH
jgi:hypothetical protein